MDFCYSQELIIFKSITGKFFIFAFLFFQPQITVRSATSAKTVAYALTENIPLSASACQVSMEKIVEVWYLNLPVWLRMRRRRHLTPFSNVCEAAPMSLFWANGLNELPEMRFEFPFNLIGRLTMALLTGQSWRVLKSWYTWVGAQTKDFGAVLQMDLIRSLLPSVVQASSKLVCLLFVYISC